MKEKNNNNIFIILKNEFILFFRSLYTGIITTVKYGPYSVIYLLSTIAIFIDNFLRSIIENTRYFFRKLVANIIKRIENSKIVTNHRKKAESKLRVLTIDKLDKKINKKKVIYEYLARIPGRNLEKGYYSAYSAKDVYEYLIRKGYTVYEIKTGKWIKFLNDNISYLNDTVEESDMLLWLNHLCVSLQKNITPRDAFMTIAKNNKKKKYKKLLENIIDELIKGESLSFALSKQGNSFPDDLISLIRKAEYNDNVVEALSDYLDKKYKEIENNTVAEPSNSSVIIFLLILGFVIYKVIQYFINKNNIYTNNININTDAYVNTSSINQSILTIIDFLKNHFYIVILIVIIILVFM